MADNKEQNDRKKSLDTYIRFSTVAIQMAVIITAGALGGHWLDGYLELKFPIFTVVLSLICIGLALYLVIKEVLKNSKNKNE